MGIRKVFNLCDSLIETTPDVLEKIKEFEKKGLLNEHLDPIDEASYIPVSEDYKYLDKPFKERLKYFFIYNFIVKPMELRELRRMGFKVKGRKNLKGIKTAVITSNHVNKLDCSLNRKALKGHKLYITAASFNNVKGLLGDIMRSSRMMPLGEGTSAMKKFDKTINTLLKGKNYVLFYPEQSEWWCYKKPRPLKPGAFHYAVKNMVPVIPLFITFKDTNKKFKNGLPRYKMTVNILPAIYPKKELNKQDNMKEMMDKNFNLWKELYEKEYNIPLKYSFEVENHE